MAQKSTQCTYCQLYTCLYASYTVHERLHEREGVWQTSKAHSAIRQLTLLFTFVLFRRWIAS